MLKAQLLRETVVEKAGELLEAQRMGNQQPSPEVWERFRDYAPAAYGQWLWQRYSPLPEVISG